MPQSTVGFRDPCGHSKFNFKLNRLHSGLKSFLTYKIRKNCKMCAYESVQILQPLQNFSFPLPKNIFGSRDFQINHSQNFFWQWSFWQDFGYFKYSTATFKSQWKYDRRVRLAIWKAVKPNERFTESTTEDRLVIFNGLNNFLEEFSFSYSLPFNDSVVQARLLWFLVDRYTANIQD